MGEMEEEESMLQELTELANLEMEVRARPLYATCKADGQGTVCLGPFCVSFSRCVCPLHLCTAA